MPFKKIVFTAQRIKLIGIYSLAATIVTIAVAVIFGHLFDLPFSTLVSMSLVIVVIWISAILLDYQVIQKSYQADMLKFALKSANAGAWYWDIKNDVVVWDENTHKLMGVNQQNGRLSKITYDTFINHVHPEDRQKVSNIVEKAIKEGGDYFSDFRVRMPNGDIEYRLTRGMTKKDSNGELETLAGILFDLTEQRKLQASLEEKEIELETIINHLPNTFIFWKNKEGIFLGCNNALAQSIGLKSCNDIIGKTDYDLPWTKAESDHYRADDFAVMESRQPKLNIDEQQTLNDGRVINLLTNKVPLFDNQNNVVGVLGIYFNVTERKHMELELEESNKNLAKTLEQLKNANLAKDQFLASMSHELRTPLNSIIGYIGVLLMKLSGPLNAEQEKQLLTIKKSSRHLLALINGLLNLSKIESGKIELIFEMIECQEVVQEIYEILSPLAATKGLGFNFKIKPEKFTIHTDRKILTQILFNLVNNAIKFTEQGEINLEVIQNENSVSITVSDTGIGISEEDKNKLFNEFQQIDPEKYGGTGLGLYLSKRFSSLINSEITMESELGKGSRFSINLPITKTRHEIESTGVLLCED